jgi:hypothetical protein
VVDIRVIGSAISGIRVGIIIVVGITDVSAGIIIGVLLGGVLVIWTVVHAIQNTVPIGVGGGVGYFWQDVGFPQGRFDNTVIGSGPVIKYVCQVIVQVIFNDDIGRLFFGVAKSADAQFVRLATTAGPSHSIRATLLILALISPRKSICAIADFQGVAAGSQHK